MTCIWAFILLSILLRCNGFSGIQKDIVDRASSSPPNLTRTPFFLQVWPWEVLWCFFSIQPLSRSSPVVSCPLFIAQSINGSLLSGRKREDTSKQLFFFSFFDQLVRHSLVEIFHLSNLLQMPNDHRMVDVEFFSNFSCSCKRISFSDPLYCEFVSCLLTTTAL